MKAKTHINQLELFFVVVQSMIGVTTLSLPFYAYKAAAYDGWISVFIAGCGIQLLVLLIWILHRKFPGLTLFDFSQIILGKILGRFINFLYIIYLLFIVSYTFNVMNDIIIRWILPETPQWMLMILATILMVYGCIGSLKNMISLYSFIFIFIIVLFFISLLTFQDPIIDIRNLFPIGSNGVWEILKGTEHTLISFIGFETLLFYFAFVKQPKKLSSAKGAFFAVSFVTLFYTYIVIVSMMMFSTMEMKIVPEPVLYMLRAINLNILQRLDLIFLTVWAFVVASTALSYGFLGSMGISKLFRIKHKPAVVIAGIVFVCLSIISYLFIEIRFFTTLVSKLNLIFGIILPIFLLFTAIIFKRKAEPAHEEK